MNKATSENNLEIPKKAGAIPNINLANVYDRKFAREDIQYATLSALAETLGRQSPAHRHDDFLQVHLISTGHFELMLDTVHSSATAPAIFLTPPTVPHAFSLSPNARGHVLTVRRNILLEAAEQDPSLPAPENLKPFCIEFRGESGRRQFREIALIFLLLQRELSEPRPGAVAICAGLSRAIVAMAIRITRHSEQSASLRQDLIYYRRFLQLVDRHYREHPSIGFFAEKLHMTEWRLYDITATCAATTPKSILRERLLQEAKRQLAFSTVSIKEISAHLGYSDAPYFCRVFRRTVGQTPSDYRASIQQSAEA